MLKSETGTKKRSENSWTVRTETWRIRSCVRMPPSQDPKQGPKDQSFVLTQTAPLLWLNFAEPRANIKKEASAVGAEINALVDRYAWSAWGNSRVARCAAAVACTHPARSDASLANSGVVRSERPSPGVAHSNGFPTQRRRSQARRTSAISS